MHKIYEQKNLPYLNVQVCPHCKQLVALNLKVCPRCGHPIVEDKKEESVDEFPTQTVEMTTSNLKTPENQVDEIDASLDTTNLKNDKDVEKKEKEPSLFLRQFFNLFTIASLIFGLVFLLWGSYFSMNELGLDHTMYSISYTGIQILSFNKKAFFISNGITQFSIFSNSNTYQQVGMIALFSLYAILTLFLVLGIFISFVRLIKRQKPITKFYGFILIPSGILWIVSFIHSLVLEKSNFMKENQFDVNSSTIYLFLLLFICWILLMFIFLKDDNRPILKKQKQKQKKESLEDDLFLD